MINRIIIVSFLLMITSKISNAQNDWREGYIIRHSGDTTYGFIDYRDFESNSRLCYFRSTEKGDTEKFTPDQILGYRYTEDKYYVSKTVNLYGKETTVFLEFLIHGQASIYYYKDADEHYFLEKGDEIHELKNSEIPRYVDGTEYVQEKKEYVGMLRYHFQDAAMEEAIANTKLDHKSLIKVAKKYHNRVCSTEECIVYEKKEQSVKFDVGIVYGAKNPTIYFTSSIASYELSNEYSEFGGIAINLHNIPGIYEKFYLQVELVGSSYFFKKGQNSMFPDNEKGYALNIPVMIGYRFFGGKIYPSVDFGASTYFIKSEELETKHFTLMLGGNINFEMAKNFRIFVSTRYELNPAILRFGAGLMF